MRWFKHPKTPLFTPLCNYVWASAVNVSRIARYDRMLNYILHTEYLGKVRSSHKGFRKQKDLKNVDSFRYENIVLLLLLILI